MTNADVSGSRLELSRQPLAERAPAADSLNAGTKILWVVLIVLLPLLGMILYFLMGPGRRRVI